MKDVVKWCEKLNIIIKCVNNIDSDFRDETALRLVTHHNNRRWWKWWFLLHFLNDTKTSDLNELITPAGVKRMFTSSAGQIDRPQLERFAWRFSLFSPSFRRCHSALARLCFPARFRWSRWRPGLAERQPHPMTSPWSNCLRVDFDALKFWLLRQFALRFKASAIIINNFSRKIL